MVKGQGKGASGGRRYIHTLTVVSARLRYEVTAHRPLSYAELTEAIAVALKDGRLREPGPGGTATLNIWNEADLSTKAIQERERLSAPAQDAATQGLSPIRASSHHRRWRWPAIAVALLLALGYYVSPAVSIYRLTAALRARDPDAIAEHVDFPALRESLRGQLAAQMTAGASNHPKRAEGTLAALGAMLAVSIATAVADSVATPYGVIALLDVSGRNAQPSRPSPGDVAVSALRHGGFDGLEDYRVEREGSTERFRLEGLTWRLVGFVAPAATVTAAAAKGKALQ